jgi:TPR repeat protein
MSPPRPFTSAVMGLLVAFMATTSATAQTGAARDEANRQRQMEAMRQHSLAADRATAERAYNAGSRYSSGSAPYSGSPPSSGSGSSSPLNTPVAQGGSLNSGPQSVVATYTIPYTIRETPEQAGRRLLPIAQGGDARAQYFIARMYYSGFGLAQDDTQARRFFQAAADQGHPAAAGYAGYLASNGIGGPANKNAAMGYLTTAKNAGDPYGMTLWAMARYEETFFEGTMTPSDETVPVLIRAADAGEPLAQTMLGTLIFRGNGVPGYGPDLPRAMGYLRQGAAANNPMAIYNLGLMLFMTDEPAIRANLAEGRQMIERAAAMGFGEAQLMLGMSLATGSNGFRADVSRGQALVRQAADGGNPKAQRTYGLALSNGELGLRADPVAGFGYLKRASDAGNAAAQASAAMAYYNGDGTAKNPSEFARLIRLSAEAGDGFGQYVYGEALMDGPSEDGVAENKPMAAQWFQKAAAQGEAGAVTRMAEPEIQALLRQSARTTQGAPPATKTPK